MRLFLDSDGVFADFEAGHELIFGTKVEATFVGRMWKNINGMPEFYASIPKKPDADLLWDALKDHDVTVLTGCPTSGFDAAAAAKRKWWGTNYAVPEHRVITCFSKDKALHMVEPGDILIDDTARNIDKWIAAGGIGILHTSAEDTLAQLATLSHT